MTHLIELLMAVPLVIAAYRFAAYEMRQDAKLTDDERAERQEALAW